MKTTITSTCILLLSLLVGGCATVPPKALSEFDDKVDFTTYRTFALAPMETRVPGANPEDILRVGPAMKEAARQTMLAKGYTEVAEPKSADLVIRVHSKIVPKTEVTDWGFTPAYPTYRWYRRYPYATYGTRQVTVDNYKEGTLIVEAHDARSRDMVWVGWVTGRTEERKDRVLEAATSAVNDILAAFPAKGAQPAAIVAP